MSDEPDGTRRQRRLIVERLTLGVLPRHRDQRTFGGRGEGTLCACCDEPIAPADVQYDVEQRDSATADVPEQVRSLCMHLHCYRLWIEESQKRGGP
ncbi:MAG TPA: hypothetical protein VMF64_09325 [Steroidobacteraceae bacterium]|nr:hypothetical protein [Steroidobacteraceae bacterium]